ncbi:MAG: energy-coupling factor transporter ATPase [Microbacterium sp.]
MPVSADPDAVAARPGTADPVLRVSALSITHDEADARTIADVSFEVALGEVVLLLGPSGAGKSTLALALNGLIPQAVPARIEGVVEAAGLRTADTPVATLSTHVAMVFQDPDAQLVTGTVLDETAFGPENLMLPVDEVLRRSESALRRVGLWERRHENPDLLSGGGRQRLAIAAALAMGSPLIVLDEPTANLDPACAEEVYDALSELIAAHDRSIVLIEHDLDSAIGLVTRVIVLGQDGRLLADGPAGEVLRARADELHDLGVWLPTAALAALRLRRAGYRLDPLPLTPGELREALIHTPRPPAAPARASGPAAAAEALPPTPATRAPNAVSVRGLTLRRGRTPVLHDVSLDVPRGAFVAVIGANGAGKTSLLQAIAGVVPPPRGTVRVDGVDVARADPRTLPSHIGFVFQNPEHQFIAHTVWEEAAHGLRRQGLPADEVRVRTDELLRRFGLTAHAQRHPFLLSGGQKRRLAVGTALVTGAAVLALDEPTFGQDRARADELLGLLRELNEAGTTIIVVTHDMQLAGEYADRVVVMQDGRIAAARRTAAVFDDDALLAGAGLRPPPLRRALAGLTRHPELSEVTRLADLPGGAG